MHVGYLLVHGHKLGPLHELGSPPPLPRYFRPSRADMTWDPLNIYTQLGAFAAWGILLW